ncbi:tRNA glutamyl-Q(34) synthetase GluQRS [soil metagenome]
MKGYVGRFAPSPSGALHAGSLAAALASWLDARAHHGSWRLRIEDIDPPREVPGAAGSIIATLAAHGLHWDGPIVHQSQRSLAYETAFAHLSAAGLLYPCGCSRSEIAAAATTRGSDGEPIYPGTCRNGLTPGRSARSWRMRMPDRPIAFIDRRLGRQVENPAVATGDIVLRRADGLWSYQLAVVVDDIEAGVTDVVRGEDLLASTARQIALYQAFGVTPPHYLHVGLLRDAAGVKLGKQTGAVALEAADADRSLREAAGHLGLDAAAAAPDFMAAAIAEWTQRFLAPPSKAPTLPA